MARAEASADEIDVAASLGDLVGDTPLLALDAIGDSVYGKVEAANPYSVKDRIAREILDDAEAAGDLSSGGTVVEATSGNTGIGLAAMAAARGYDCVLTMPDSMSTERRQLLRALGAELVLTPGEDGMGGARDRARAIVAEHDRAVLARQFETRANPRAHRETTGPEIWEATDGTVDAVVAGVGTGGTITGVMRHISEDRGARDVTAVAVEPAASPTLSEQSSASHEIQGIGPGWIPDTLDVDLVDEVHSVGDDEAMETARLIAREEGLLVGISAGAAAAAAGEYATAHPEETVVAVLPDGGERYLSTGLYEVR